MKIFAISGHFEAGYGGGKTIEEFYETHPKMGEERNLEEFKRDYGVVFSIVSKNGKAVFMVTDAGMKKSETPTVCLRSGWDNRSLGRSGKDFLWDLWGGRRGNHY